MRLLTIILIITLAGCATSGRKITDQQISQVVAGQTTRAELLSMFGRPTSETINSDGTVIMGWGYAHVGFAGIGTEVQGVSMTVGPDGTVQAFSRTGSRPGASIVPPPTATPSTTAQPSQQPLSEAQYKQTQLDALMKQNLPYDQYQRRYKEIMGE